MKKTLILCIILCMLIGSYLFPEGVTEDTTYARTILEREDAVSTYFQQVVEPFTLKDGPLQLTAVPVLGETYVLSEYPEMMDERFSSTQMVSKLEARTRALDSQQEMSGTFLVILRYERNADVMGLSSFTIDPSFFEYTFLYNDKGDYLYVGNHPVVHANTVEADNKVLEFWVTFGENEAERKKFFQNSRNISISVTAFGFEGPVISYALPISGMFYNMPKEPKELLASIRSMLDIGDIGPAGGLIFYNKGNDIDGWRYLEAAPAVYEWSGKVWGGFGSAVGGTGTAIGTGESNTEKIVAKFGNAEPYEMKTDYAAKLCADLVVTKDGVTYDDWFLPSKDEL